MYAQMPRAVLVTGGRGFIGRAVGRLLQREGYRVISMDRNAVTPAREMEGISEVVCDITHSDGLRNVFESEHIGGIVHLAAILPTTAQRAPELATRVNVEGSLNLLEMATQFGVGRLVFGSSLSVYGTCSAEQVVSELDRAAPEDLYGAAKIYVEQLGEAYRNLHGIEFVSLRIGRVVGAGAQSATSAWRSQIFEFLAAKDPLEINLPHHAAERILLVHVADVARMLVTLLEAPGLAHGVYNAVCESVVVGELKQEVERLNPALHLKLGGEAVVGNPRRLDSARFTREFGFETVPIMELLRVALGRAG